MKVKFKLNGKSVVINFNVHPTSKGNIAVVPSTSKDLDMVQEIISSSEALVIQKGLLKHMESKLSIPLTIDHNYPGAGFGFKIDMYSLMSKLK